MKAGTQGREKRVKRGMGERETLIMIQGQGGRGREGAADRIPLNR